MPSKDASGKTTWSTPEVLTAVAVAMAVGVATGFLLDEAKDEEFDEDRPPIIVSNGSADFEGKSSHANYNKANWEQFPPSQNRIFKHVQPGGIAVGSFSLDTYPAYDATDPTKTISSCTFNSATTNSRPPFTGTSASVFYSTAGEPNTLYESKMAIGVADELVLTLVAEDGEVQGGGKKIKVKDANSSPPNRKMVRSFSIGKYSCVLSNQGTTSVEVRQVK